MVTFENYDRRKASIDACLKENKIKDLEECRKLCLDKGVDVEKIVRGVQPICFDNAVWAYTLGCAIAIKRGIKEAKDRKSTRLNSSH